MTQANPPVRLDDHLVPSLLSLLGTEGTAADALRAQGGEPAPRFPPLLATCVTNSGCFHFGHCFSLRSRLIG